MASFPSSVLNTETNIQSLLLRNPTVADGDLEGAIRCNLIDFTGKVSVSTKRYKFATGEKTARVIYITPYTGTDGIRSLKRFLIGVKFQGGVGDEDRITNYVLGKLAYTDPNHAIAKRETDEALNAGRRLIIAVTKDDIRIELEKDREGWCTVM